MSKNKANYQKLVFEDLKDFDQIKNHFEKDQNELMQLLEEIKKDSNNKN